MKTTTNINLNNVLQLATGLIQAAKRPNDQVSKEDIKRIYNHTCDNRESVFIDSFDPDEYQLASTIAIGAVAEQEGSGIQATAAIACLEDFLS